MINFLKKAVLYMKVSLIVAMDMNRVIGKEGEFDEPSVGTSYSTFKRWSVNTCF